VSTQGTRAAGRTLGISGLGQIGREIAKRAQSFGLRVVAWSRQLTTEDATRLAIGYCQTPVEVARQSDIVSINVAATAETKQLVNAEFLAAMRPGSYLINRRGSVVDEAALAGQYAKRSGRTRCLPGRAERLRRFKPAMASPACSVPTVGASTDQAGGDRARDHPDRAGVQSTGGCPGASTGGSSATRHSLSGTRIVPACWPMSSRY
jgi:D-3-phosphoglycerate dehydrogenase